MNQDGDGGAFVLLVRFRVRRLPGGMAEQRRLAGTGVAHDGPVGVPGPEFFEFEAGFFWFFERQLPHKFSLFL